MQLIAQLSWPVIVGACVMASAAALANMISLVMIGKINERLPAGERISYILWSSDVRKKFKQLYPSNRLVFFLDACVITMVLCFVLLAKIWVFG